MSLPLSRMTFFVAYRSVLPLNSFMKWYAKWGTAGVISFSSVSLHLYVSTDFDLKPIVALLLLCFCTTLLTWPSWVAVASLAPRLRSLKAHLEMSWHWSTDKLLDNQKWRGLQHDVIREMDYICRHGDRICWKPLRSTLLRGYISVTDILTLGFGARDMIYAQTQNILCRLVHVQYFQCKSYNIWQTLPKNEGITTYNITYAKAKRIVV